MVVLQFALGDDPTNPHLPQNHEEQSVVYTGTHDNDTTTRLVGVADRRGAARGPGSTRPTRVELIEVAWASRAALAIAPLQDVLALGSEARMNLPGTRGGQLAVALRRAGADRRERSRSCAS